MEDPLDDFLAPLTLKVDVRRLVAIRRYEALKQKAAADWIDGGDAQHVADGGIGGGPPALAQDAFRSRVAEDAVHRQEVGRVFEVGDQPQFVGELLIHRWRLAVRIPHG